LVAEVEGLILLVGVSSESLLKWRGPEAEGVLALPVRRLPLLLVDHAADQVFLQLLLFG